LPLRGVCYSARMERKFITSKEIGDVIRRRRRELVISQERLAEILDVSYQQVQRYENGSNKLNVESIQNVAAALAVPVAYFFESAASDLVTEHLTPHQPAEEKTLLKHFRQISARNNKLVVISVARLAAKGT
jgi:transcriptional regulator with XRE-family HTH domain